MNTTNTYFPNEITGIIMSFLNDEDRTESMRISKSFFHDFYQYKLKIISKDVTAEIFNKSCKTKYKNVIDLTIDAENTSLTENDIYKLKHVKCLTVLNFTNECFFTNLQKFEKLEKLRLASKYDNLFPIDFSKLYCGKLNSLKKLKFDRPLVNFYENLLNFPLLEKIHCTKWFNAEKYDINSIKNNKNITSITIFPFLCNGNNYYDNLDHVKKIKINSPIVVDINFLEHFKDITHLDCSASNTFNDFNCLINLEKLVCHNANTCGLNSCVNLKKLRITRQKSNLNLSHLLHLEELRATFGIFAIDMRIFGVEKLMTLRRLILEFPIFSAKCNYTINLSKLTKLEYVDLNEYFIVETCSMTSTNLTYINVPKWTNNNSGTICVNNIKNFSISDRKSFENPIINFLPKLKKISVRHVDDELLLKYSNLLLANTNLKELCCDYKFVKTIDCKKFKYLKSVTIFPGYNVIDIFNLSDYFNKNLVNLTLESMAQSVKITDMPNLRHITCVTNHIDIHTTTCKNIKIITLTSNQKNKLQMSIVGNKQYSYHTIDHYTTKITF